MTFDDSQDERLRELRRTDTTGVYAGDRPTEGTDRTGVLTVTIDPTNRVVGAQVSEGPDVRTPEGLALAFEAAYAAAVAARLQRREAREPRPESQRPVAVATRPVFHRPTPEQLNRHRIRHESASRPRRGRPGQVEGVSGNDCVHVTLAPAQPTGTVMADRGWLANAQTVNIASALVEAFTDAYDKRDHR
jgi:hypothetical protein